MFALVLLLATLVVASSDVAKAERPQASPAARVLTLAGDRVWDVGDYADVLLDESGMLTLEDVRRSAAFRPVGAPRRTFRLRRGVFWLRLTMRDEAPAVGHRIEFAHPRPIALTSFWPDASGAFVVRKGGLVVPLAEREVVSRSVVVPFALPRGQDVTVYFRLDTTPLGFSAIVGSNDACARRSGHEEWLLGIYYGIVAGLFLYNFFLLVVLRDQTYAWYLAFLGTTTLFFLSRNGYFFEWGWTAGSHTSGGAVVALQTIAIVNFTRNLLGTQDALPRVDRALSRVVAAYAVVLVAALCLPSVLHEMRISPYSALCLLAVLGIGLARLRQGAVLARYYLGAWALFLSGALLYVLKSTGTLPHTAFTEHAMQAGSALESVLLSLALAHRIRTMELEARARVSAAALERSEHARRLDQLRAESAARILESQDEHSRALARDLHDSVGHRFLLIERAATDSHGRDDADVWDAIAALAREGVAETREIAHGMYPQRLLDLGLVGALQATAEGARRAGLAVVTAFDPRGAEALGPRGRLAALRIVEEATQNVLRHAEARALRMTLRLADAKRVELEVSDDGRGIDRARPKGLGLRTMADRAAQAGGTLEVEARRGGGTSVTLRMPRDDDRAPDARGASSSA